MEFINTYFGVQFGAFGRLLALAKDAWDQKNWFGFITVMMWTVVCTIAGIMFLPIDLTYSILMWCKEPMFREIAKDLKDEMTVNQN